MKKQLKRAIGICLCLAVAVTSAAVIPTKTAKASKMIIFTLSKSNTVTKYSDKAMNLYFFKVSTSKIPKGATVSKVTSSKKSVATITNEPASASNGNGCGLTIIAKKAGTATMKIKAKKDSKSYTYKAKVTVVKYKNPASTLKIGSKSLKKKYNKALFYTYKKFTQKKLKISVKAIKNWKIKKIKYKSVVPGKSPVTKTIKNNKKFTRTANATSEYLIFTFYNKKTTKLLTQSTDSNKTKDKGIEVLTLTIKE